MIQVVHFHYNTAENVNIGDEAHVLAIQDTLRDQIGDIRIINLPISFLCHYQLPPLIGISQKLPLSIHNAARILRGTSYGQLLKKIDEADLVVIGGGGVYMDHLLPFNIPLVRRIKTPVVIFGAGYNHNFKSAEFNAHQIESIKELGQKATMHGVRDTNTLNFLKKQGIKAELIGDPAMFLKRADTMPRKKEITIGINIAAHGWKQQSTYQSQLVATYADMIARVQKRHKVAFRYFIHHPAEHEIVEALKEKGVVFTSIVDSDARATKAEYAAVDFAVSMMLHSTILAFGEGKPSIAVGYDDKNKSFMDLTRQAKRYTRVDEVTSDSLTQKVEDLIANLNDEATDVEAGLRELKASYDDFSRRVATLVL
jgi:polysaccharide pyruvyl transferase WcaK-like protein